MEKATILKTVALLDLKMAEMDSLGLTTLKSIYYSTLYVNLQGNYPVLDDTSSWARNACHSLTSA